MTQNEPLRPHVPHVLDLLTKFESGLVDINFIHQEGTTPWWQLMQSESESPTQTQKKLKVTVLYIQFTPRYTSSKTREHKTSSHQT